MNIISWYNSTEEEREEFLESEESGTTDLDRYEGEDRERYDVEEVPFTIYERGVVSQALHNEIDYWERQMKEGHTVPERISILRNALQSVEQFDGTDSWGEPISEKEDGWLDE